MTQDRPYVLGFTGAVGAGCSTATEILKYERGYRTVRLSSPIRDEWSVRHPDDTATREQLQALGDEMRATHGRAALVERALESLGDSDSGANIAIDGVRNLGEVEELQERFGHRFLLVAVLAQKTARWNRIGNSEYRGHGLTQADFDADDLRDQGEEGPEGQQVGLCVDSSDAIIDNSSAVTLEAYTQKVLDTADLLTRREVRAPSPHEIRMHTAFSQSHSSRCLKRHVGAVVIASDQEVAGVGYNENPLTMHPCVDEPTYEGRCFRDIVRNRQFVALVASATRCPSCAEPLEPVTGPPWHCAACRRAGKATDLERYFFPERAMNWCTAIHAEDRALRNAGEKAKGGLIYTTTFPCFGCAERIISAGVKTVVFTEPYPDVASADRLRLAKVEVRQFEGVRSSAFERIFAAVRPT